MSAPANLLLGHLSMDANTPLTAFDLEEPFRNWQNLSNGMSRLAVMPSRPVLDRFSTIRGR